MKRAILIFIGVIIAAAALAWLITGGGVLRERLSEQPTDTSPTPPVASLGRLTQSKSAMTTQTGHKATRSWLGSQTTSSGNNAATAQAAIDSLNDGLVAYYPFNGNADDQSENGNNGTVYGALYETYSPGQTALRFNGTAATYVVVPRSASLEPQDAITISLWCKGVPGTGQQYGTILRKADDGNAGYFIRTANSGILDMTETFRLDLSQPFAGRSASDAAFTPSTDVSWQHLVATYFSNDGLKTYVNGVLISQTPPMGQLKHSGNLFIGGATVHYQDGGFNGLINDVRIYNRALSTDEILALYNLRQQ